MNDVVNEHLSRADASVQAHEELERKTSQLIELMTAWNRKLPDRKALLDGAEVLSRFRHHLLCHFLWEECDGYMDPVLRLDPTRYHEVDRLRRDHGILRRVAADLHEDIVVAAYGGPVATKDLPARLRDLLRDINDHERREHVLIQEVFYRDAGGGG